MTITGWGVGRSSDRLVGVSEDAVQELRAAYNKAEAEFLQAYGQLEYWKEETDRRNKVASDALNALALAEQHAKELAAQEDSQ